MTLRRAGPDDLDATVDLTIRAYAPWTELLGAPPMPVTEDYAPRIARGEVWLLEDAGGLAGLIVLEDEPERLTIYSVAVDPRRQGAGLGRRLLAFAESEAASRGYQRLYLYTNARMTRNVDLYRHCGFVETGRRSNPNRPGWMAVDMEKMLAPMASARTA